MVNNANTPHTPDTPEHGPNILFFSGGTALRGMSRKITKLTHNSVHIITPYDSGGSSAVLRKAFDMPAVGDIRNRLMALADLSEEGAREIFALFTYRFSKKTPQVLLEEELERLANGSHFLVDRVPASKKGDVLQHLQCFLEMMPSDFDLRGASIGNLILTAGYMAEGRQLAPVIDHFSQLASVRGGVRPVVDADLHMAAELEDGSVVVGQHCLTGKEVSPLKAKIKRVWQTDSLDSAQPVQSAVSDEVAERIQQAQLICFPLGSFYSSIIANLLPHGVGKAVAANSCKKVFIPNPVGDPELLGHTVEEQVALLKSYLIQSGAPEDAVLITDVLVDSRAEYPGDLDLEALVKSGLKVSDIHLQATEGSRRFDSKKLSEALVALAS